MLDGAVDHPVASSARTSSRVGSSSRVAEHLREQPRVAERAAGEHDRRAAGVLEHAADVLGARRMPPETITGTGSSSTSSRGEVVVGRALVAHGGASAGGSVIAGDAGLVDEPVGELEALDAAGLAAGAQLDRDRQAGALARGARDRDRGVGVA